MQNTGLLSINNSNVFNIIKRWLYTEPDIVFRELVSNSTDAIEKLSTIELNNNSSYKGEIIVTLDPEQKQLIISDNGIGMTYEEVEKYINTVAFSGAEDYIKRQSQSGANNIIGHFGVGFYSAFMLSDDVSIESKSFKNDAAAVRWDCSSDMSYKMSIGTKTSIGTDITLNLNDNDQFLKNPKLIFESLKKYFLFSKYNVYFQSPEHNMILVNNTTPLWKKSPEEIDKNQMNQFYQDYFSDSSEPLFWVQFSSIDIGLRGIIYFRNTKNSTEELNGTVKIYSRGIYVGENIPQLIPKFINLQNGIIECDDLPLLVSRSHIQDDSTEDSLPGLISECLTQEVVIALNDLFVNNRETYESYWPELNAFVKYGVLQDKTVASVMLKKVIFEDFDGKYQTIEEYLNKENGAPEKTIYYSSDRLEQAHYIEIFKRHSKNALLFDHVIDSPFLYRYEVASPNLKFTRIDSNIPDVYDGILKEEDEVRIKKLNEKAYSILGDRIQELKLHYTRLKDPSISTLIVNDESSRRVSDMMSIYGYNQNDEDSLYDLKGKTLIFNLDNKLVQFVEKGNDIQSETDTLNHLFDLALLSQQALPPKAMIDFINRSEKLLSNSII